MKIKLILMFIMALLVFSTLSFAQSSSTGAIDGKVKDEEGNPLPGAEVKLFSPDMIGGTKSYVTDATGKYRFPAIQRGSYTLEASLPGFTPSRRENIRLFVGQTITVDLTLKIAAIEEAMTVTGVAPLVDVKSSQTTATNLDNRAIETVVATRLKSASDSELLEFAPGASGRSIMGSSTGRAPCGLSMA